MHTKIHKTTIKALALALITVYISPSYAADTKVAGKLIESSGTPGETESDHRQYRKAEYDKTKSSEGEDIHPECQASRTGKCFDEDKSREKAVKFKTSAAGFTETKTTKDEDYKNACRSGNCNPGYDINNYYRDKYGRKVELNPGDTGFTPKTIHMGHNQVHGVVSGTKDDDAANIGDVKKMTQGLNDDITKNTDDIKNLDKRTTALEKKTTELDTQVKQLKSDIRSVEKRANRGIASAMASASLNLSSQLGEYAIAVGTATYRGEGALAVGASMRSADGHWGTNASVNLNNDDVGATLSVGYHW